ncbi:hypothetical protein JX265_012547 [Neoarthrinium moseri]|uniref:Uncharacterized protein n=1 Tax=Neoarthrinium moseri TaxID=1658444 RepID=A0A9Q0AGQ2_9PEZI|nr:hypothetical protein JX265_012547 [Neoarthrinium moseri]
MGLSVSREIATAILNTDGGLLALIRDEDFVTECREIWRGTPKEVKTFIRNLAAPRLWTPATLSTKRIQLDKDVESRLKIWEEDPTTFFDRGALDDDFLSVCRYFKELDNPLPNDTLRRRALLVALHDVKVTTGCFDVATRLASAVGESKVSKSKFHRWAEWGGRYYGYVSHFENIGVVLALDTTITRTQYEHFIPATGDDRDLFLDIQRQRGLGEVANKCKRAADRIVKHASSLILAAIKRAETCPSNCHANESDIVHEKRQRKRKRRPIDDPTRRKISKQPVRREKQAIAGTSVWSIAGHDSSPVTRVKTPAAPTPSGEAASSVNRPVPDNARDSSAPNHLDPSVGSGQQTDPTLSFRQTHGQVIASFNETGPTSCSTGMVSGTPVTIGEEVHHVPDFTQLQEQECRNTFAAHSETPLYPSPLANLPPDNHYAQPEPEERDTQNGHMAHWSGIEANTAASGIDMLAKAATQAATSWQNLQPGIQRGQLRGYEPMRPDADQPNNIPMMALDYSRQSVGLDMTCEFSHACPEAVEFTASEFGTTRQDYGVDAIDWNNLMGDMGFVHTYDGPADLV